MKRPWVLALLLLAVACGAKEAQPSETRSAQRASREGRPARFDPAQSTGVFAGVRTFVHDVPQVLYAVDDAVDLAYAFAFEKKIHAIRPDRVMLLLEGEPEKPESKERLDKLLAHGAKRYPATPENIVRYLHDQAKAAGDRGLLVASFATHGFSSEETHYILASSSELHKPATALSVPKLLEVAGAAKRSLIFVDACRDRGDGQVRGEAPSDPRTGAPRLDRITHPEGQAVFYAAAPGKYAYDDLKKMNGVFTSGILECLRCELEREGRGTVSASTLATYVEKYVLKWIQENRDPSATVATQASTAGMIGKMRVASCPPPVPLTNVQFDGSRFTAFDANRRELFQKDLPYRIGDARTTDLDNDKTNEVIVSAGTWLYAFDYNGKEIWSADTEMPVRAFLAGDLLTGKNRQVVALSVDPGRRQSRLTLWDDEGVLLKDHREAGEMKHLALDRPNTSHWLKIIVTAVNPKAPRGNRAKVFWFHPKRGIEWWGFVRADTITALKITDIGDDGTRDICVTTPAGRSCFDFDGHNLEPGYVPFGLYSRPK
jgi:hypothetical protein